jgi:hypothetical protein
MGFFKQGGPQEELTNKRRHTESPYEMSRGFQTAAPFPKIANASSGFKIFSNEISQEDFSH